MVHPDESGLCAALCVTWPTYAKASVGKTGRLKPRLLSGRSLQLPYIWLSDDNIAEGLFEHLAFVRLLYGYAKAILPFLLQWLGVDRLNAGNLCRCSSQECAIRALEFFRFYISFNYGYIQLAANVQYSLSCNTRQDVTKRRSIEHAILFHKGICARRFADIFIHVEHQRIIISSDLCFTGSQNIVYIVPCYLRFHLQRVRVWTLIRRDA